MHKVVVNLPKHRKVILYLPSEEWKAAIANDIPCAEERLIIRCAEPGGAPKYPSRSVICVGIDLSGVSMRVLPGYCTGGVPVCGNDVISARGVSVSEEKIEVM